MGASLERIRKSMKVERSAGDKGLVLSLRVVAYDNGMIEVDGIPINTVEDGYDPGEGWLGAADVITSTLAEFRRQVATRQRARD